MSLGKPSVRLDPQEPTVATTSAFGLAPLENGADPNLVHNRAFDLGLFPTPQLNGAQVELIAKGGPTAPSRGKPTQEEVQQALIVALGNKFEGGREFRGKKGAPFIPQPDHFTNASKQMKAAGVDPHGSFDQHLPNRTFAYSALAPGRRPTAEQPSALLILDRAGYPITVDSQRAGMIADADATFQRWSSDFGPGLAGNFRKPVNDLLAARKQQFLAAMRESDAPSSSSHAYDAYFKVVSASHELQKLTQILGAQVRNRGVNPAELREELKFTPPKQRDWVSGEP
jgi:hypothetical protein